MINKKAFTLIELLVVVAIIGILAAVGVTTFNGFQEKAKVSATKANFKLVEKYTSAELMKCQIGDEYTFTNSGKYQIKCQTLPSDAWRVGGAMTSDPKLKFLSPFDNGVWNRDRQIALRGDVYHGSSIPDNMIGYIFLWGTTFPIPLRSCFAKPCNNSNNVLTTEIRYD